jgi:hypothetical protein
MRCAGGGSEHPSRSWRVMLTRSRRACTSVCWHPWSPRARAITPIWQSGHCQQRATRTCASTASLHSRLTEWPRLDRYQEHTIELPVADLSWSIRPTRQRCVTAVQGSADARPGRAERHLAGRSFARRAQRADASAAALSRSSGHVPHVAA